MSSRSEPLTIDTLTAALKSVRKQRKAWVGQRELLEVTPTLARLQHSLKASLASRVLGFCQEATDTAALSAIYALPIGAKAAPSPPLPKERVSSADCAQEHSEYVAMCIVGGSLVPHAAFARRYTRLTADFKDSHGGVVREGMALVDGGVGGILKSLKEDLKLLSADAAAMARSMCEYLAVGGEDSELERPEKWIEVSPITFVQPNEGLVLQRWPDRRAASEYVVCINEALNAPLSPLSTPFALAMEHGGTCFVVRSMVPMRSTDSVVEHPLRHHALRVAIEQTATLTNIFINSAALPRELDADDVTQVLSKKNEFGKNVKSRLLPSLIDEHRIIEDTVFCWGWDGVPYVIDARGLFPCSFSRPLLSTNHYLASHRQPSVPSAGVFSGGLSDLEAMRAEVETRSMVTWYFSNTFDASMKPAKFFQESGTSEMRAKVLPSRLLLTGSEDVLTMERDCMLRSGRQRKAAVYKAFKIGEDEAIAVNRGVAGVPAETKRRVNAALSCPFFFSPIDRVVDHLVQHYSGLDALPVDLSLVLHAHGLSLRHIHYVHARLVERLDFLNRESSAALEAAKEEAELGEAWRMGSNVSSRTMAVLQKHQSTMLDTGIQRGILFARRACCIEAAVRVAKKALLNMWANLADRDEDSLLLVATRLVKRIFPPVLDEDRVRNRASADGEEDSTRQAIRSSDVVVPFPERTIDLDILNLFEDAAFDFFEKPISKLTSAKVEFQPLMFVATLFVARLGELTGVRFDLKTGRAVKLRTVQIRGTEYALPQHMQTTSAATLRAYRSSALSVVRLARSLQAEATPYLALWLVDMSRSALPEAYRSRLNDAVAASLAAESWDPLSDVPKSDGEVPSSSPHGRPSLIPDEEGLKQDAAKKDEVAVPTRIGEALLQERIYDVIWPAIAAIYDDEQGPLTQALELQMMRRMCLGALTLFDSATAGGGSRSSAFPGSHVVPVAEASKFLAVTVDKVVEYSEKVSAIERTTASLTGAGGSNAIPLLAVDRATLVILFVTALGEMLSNRRDVLLKRLNFGIGTVRKSMLSSTMLGTNNMDASLLSSSKGSPTSPMSQGGLLSPTGGTASGSTKLPRVYSGIPRYDSVLSPTAVAQRDQKGDQSMLMDGSMLVSEDMSASMRFSKSNAMATEADEAMLVALQEAIDKHTETLVRLLEVVERSLERHSDRSSISKSHAAQHWSNLFSAQWAVKMLDHDDDDATSRGSDLIGLAKARVTFMESVFGREAAATRLAKSNLAEALVRNGNFVDARRCLEELIGELRAEAKATARRNRGLTDIVLQDVLTKIDEAVLPPHPSAAVLGNNYAYVLYKGAEKSVPRSLRRQHLTVNIKKRLTPEALSACNIAIDILDCILLEGDGRAPSRGASRGGHRSNRNGGSNLQLMADAHNNAGCVLLFLQRYHEAIEHFEAALRAVTLLPDDHPTRRLASENLKLAEKRQMGRAMFVISSWISRVKSKRTAAGIPLLEGQRLALMAQKLGRGLFGRKQIGRLKAVAVLRKGGRAPRRPTARVSLGGNSPLSRSGQESGSSSGTSPMNQHSEPPQGSRSPLVALQAPPPPVADPAAQISSSSLIASPTGAPRRAVTDSILTTLEGLGEPTSAPQPAPTRVTVHVMDHQAAPKSPPRTPPSMGPTPLRPHEAVQRLQRCGRGLQLRLTVNRLYEIRKLRRRPTRLGGGGQEEAVPVKRLTYQERVTRLLTFHGTPQREVDAAVAELGSYAGFEEEFLGSIIAQHGPEPTHSEWTRFCGKRPPLSSPNQAVPPPAPPPAQKEDFDAAQKPHDPRSRSDSNASNVSAARPPSSQPPRKRSPRRDRRNSRDVTKSPAPMVHQPGELLNERMARHEEAQLTLQRVGRAMVSRGLLHRLYSIRTRRATRRTKSNLAGGQQSGAAVASAGLIGLGSQ